MGGFFAALTIILVQSTVVPPVLWIDKVFDHAFISFITRPHRYSS